MKKSTFYVVASAMMLELAACGYKGPLYMPVKPVASAAQVEKNASGVKKITASATQANSSRVKVVESGVMAKTIESKSI